MGFCLFNNIAVAAAHARARGIARVAIVDYDVHHGNGTQWAFYEDPCVLFLSSHQFPFYPGTGDSDEIGRGAGQGFTVNFPLEAGATDADYERTYAGGGRSPRSVPARTPFPFGRIRCARGRSARRHARDRAAVRAAHGAIVEVADQHSGGRLVAITEGGYDLKGLAASLRSVIDVLHGSSSLDRLPAPDRSDAARRRLHCRRTHTSGEILEVIIEQRGLQAQAPGFQAPGSSAAGLKPMA